MLINPAYHAVHWYPLYLWVKFYFDGWMGWLNSDRITQDRAAVYCTILSQWNQDLFYINSMWHECLKSLNHGLEYAIPLTGHRRIHALFLYCLVHCEAEKAQILNVLVKVEENRYEWSWKNRKMQKKKEKKKENLCKSYWTRLSYTYKIWSCWASLSTY